MVEFLDDATESHWVGLSETYLGIASMRAWLEQLFKRFSTFQDCYKSI